MSIGMYASLQKQIAVHWLCANTPQRMRYWNRHFYKLRKLAAEQGIIKF